MYRCCICHSSLVSGSTAPIRWIIYTTNAIEALNSKLRPGVRTRGHFPGDEAAMKLLYFVFNQVPEAWK
jgi:putative transposase